MENIINAWFASLSSLSLTTKYKLLKIKNVYEIFNSGVSDINFITPAQMIEINKTRNQSFLDELNAALITSNSTYIHNSDINFPKCLLDCNLPPLGIFVRGKELNFEKPRVAIIGSRNPTNYGKQIAYELAFKLAPYCTIISGLARGIDGIAHEGCLNNNGYSVGVIGCGINIIYPQSNTNLYSKMYSQGSIVSEYAPNIQANKWHFPARNRLISALCDVLIVVEANIKSGTSITCDEALNIGKDIFAVPARLTDKNSFGCLKLIKDGAFLINSYKDILEYFSISEKKQTTNNSIQNLILDYLTNPQSIYSIKENFNINTIELSETLIKLESMGLIEQILPNVYKKI